MRFENLLPRQVFAQQRSRELLVAISLAAAAGLLVLISSRISATVLGLYLIAVAGLATVAIVGNLRKFMLAIVIADVAIGMDVSFFLHSPHEGGAAGIELSLTTMMLLLYWYLWLADVRYRRPNAPFPPDLSLNLPTVGIILVSILSMFVARDIELCIFAIVRLFQFLLLYAFVVQNIRSKENLDFYISTVMIVVLAESLLIILQFITKSDFAFIGFKTGSVGTLGNNVAGWRPGGTLGPPTVAAAYLVPHLLLIVGVLMGKPIALQKYLGMAAAGAGVVALIVTQTRTGWATAMSMGTLLAIFALYRGYVKLRTVLFMTVVGLLIALSFSGVIIHRLTTDDYGSARDRLPMIQVAENMVRANPVLGVGVNNYEIAMGDYPGLSRIRDFYYVVHNRYYYVWAETGTLGLLCLVWFVAVWMRNALYAFRENDPHLSPIALGVLVGIVAALFNWNAESLPGRQEEQAIWMMAAFAAALYGLAWQKRHLLARGETRSPANQAKVSDEINYYGN